MSGMMPIGKGLLMIKQHWYDGESKLRLLISGLSWFWVGLNLEDPEKAESVSSGRIFGGELNNQNMYMW
jgi:hypothetical protein